MKIIEDCIDPDGSGWQIVPKRPVELSNDDDAETAKQVGAAMMTMNKIDIAALEQAASVQKERLA